MGVLRWIGAIWNKTVDVVAVVGYEPALWYDGPTDVGWCPSVLMSGLGVGVDGVLASPSDGVARPWRGDTLTRGLIMEIYGEYCGVYGDIERYDRYEARYTQTAVSWNEAVETQVRFGDQVDPLGGCHGTVPLAPVKSMGIFTGRTNMACQRRRFVD